VKCWASVPEAEIDLLRDILLARPTIGTWLTLSDPAVAEIMASAGFDWIVVDLEHSVLSIETAGALIRTIDLKGVPPLVRLTSNDPDQIKRVLDCGADGVIVPMVLSADDAKRAVAGTRYPPAGSRGMGLGRAQAYGSGFSEYMSCQSDGPTVIVQIEHQEAVENLEEILLVQGVSGLFVGPYDLSCSMGIPGQFDDPLYVKSLERILSVASQTGMPVGIHIVEPEVAGLEQAFADGFTFVAYGTDFRFLDVMARQGIAAMGELNR
jgi:2-dehydro-3-deoxyglucarate aldolase